jgi:hypothetical protein
MRVCACEKLLMPWLRCSAYIYTQSLPVGEAYPRFPRQRTRVHAHTHYASVVMPAYMHAHAHRSTEQNYGFMRNITKTYHYYFGFKVSLQAI